MLLNRLFRSKWVESVKGRGGAEAEIGINFFTSSVWLFASTAVLAVRGCLCDSTWERDRIRLVK